MISRNAEGGFFAAHWDWIVAAAGVAVLAVGVALFAMSGGGDPEENAAAAVSRLRSAKKADTGVSPVDMVPYEHALQLAVKPQMIAEVAETGGNFLVSARRVFCRFCKKPIKDGEMTCPFCGKAQPEPEKVVVDADGDGLPDDWEKKFGLDVAQNDADADKDGDGFTNAEEYAAGTDPSDKNSHPDYFDSLKLVLPLKQTFLPFYFEKAEQLPGGKVRYYFRDPKARNDYGQRGRQYTPLQGEEIGKTGFVAKGLEKKQVKVKLAARKGDTALEKTKEVMVATIERLSDGKKIFLPNDEKGVSVDVQATLEFNRGETKTFVVVPGGTIDLYGSKYKVVDVRSDEKRAKVTLEDLLLGKIRTVEALEQ